MLKVSLENTQESFGAFTGKVFSNRIEVHHTVLLKLEAEFVYAHSVLYTDLKGL